MEKNDADAATAPEPEAVSSAAMIAAEELEAWFVRRIHNSAISRDTPLFNETHAVKEALKALLARLDV